MNMCIHIDCENILRCIDSGKLEVIKCAKRYLVENQTDISYTLNANRMERK
jgi:hypothetical protein